MIKHLEVRVHVASIALVDEPVVVRHAVHPRAEINGNEDIGVYFFGLDLVDFRVLVKQGFKALFIYFCGYFVVPHPINPPIHLEYFLAFLRSFPTVRNYLHVFRIVFFIFFSSFFCLLHFGGLVSAALEAGFNYDCVGVY